MSPTPTASPSASGEAPGTGGRRSGRPALRLSRLSRSFREGEQLHEVLRGLELEVLPGEFVALLGPSGSGKSTLLNLIAGIDVPDEGAVEVDGVSLHQLRERERTLVRRDRMGFVFQFFNLIPTLTVEENLLLPLELAGRTREEDRQRAQGLLAEVGLGDRGRSWPDRLSGGEQQRVALARALVHRPALVLADEPTGNLDRRTGERVLDLLVRLVRETGTTLVMVTHAEDAALRADRVLDLVDGTLVERPRP
jgi:putative ABC transport system ATP-binding protein